MITNVLPPFFMVHSVVCPPQNIYETDVGFSASENYGTQDSLCLQRRRLTDIKNRLDGFRYVDDLRQCILLQHPRIRHWYISPGDAHHWSVKVVKCRTCNYHLSRIRIWRQFYLSHGTWHNCCYVQFVIKKRAAEVGFKTQIFKIWKSLQVQISGFVFFKNTQKVMANYLRPPCLWPSYPPQKTA